MLTRKTAGPMLWQGTNLKNPVLLNAARAAAPVNVQVAPV
jgi:hypothetical protein